MQAGQTKHGMQTMNQSLYDLYMRHLISYEEALGRSSLPDEMVAMVQKSGVAPVAQRAAR